MTMDSSGPVKTRIEKRSLIFILLGLSVQLGMFNSAQAGPAGGEIVGGSGDISQQGFTTSIQQNSSSLAINWDSFDVRQNEIVNFLQPGRSSIALNRILNQNGSQIHGQINANGQVIHPGLINV